MRQALDGWPQPNVPGYTTVLKTLQIMEAKGLVRHERVGRAYVYRPSLRRDEHVRDRLRELLQGLMGKDRVELVSALVDEANLSQGGDLRRSQDALDAEEEQQVRLLVLTFLVCQIGLLPLSLIYLKAVPLGAGVRFQWALHRGLLIGSCILPLLGLVVASQNRATLVPGGPGESVVPIGGVPDPVAPDVGPLHGGAPSAELAPARSPAWPRLLSTLLLVASGAGLGLLAYRVGVHRRWVRELLATGRRSRFGRLRVVVTAGATVPASFGIVRPHLILPMEGRMSSRDGSMVFAHEGYHLRREHAFWSTLETVLKAVFWYLPMPRMLQRGGAQIRELLCDVVVGRRYGRKAYGRLLLRTAERSSVWPTPGFATGWMGSGSLRSRVRILLGIEIPRTSSAARLATGAAAAVCALVLVAGLPGLPSAAALGAREAPVLSYFDLGQIRGSTSDEARTIFVGSVSIGYDAAKHDIADDLMKQRHRIANAIMTWISEKIYRELRRDQFERLRRQLVGVVNGVISAGKVQEVLLDGFTIVR